MRSRLAVLCGVLVLGSAAPAHALTAPVVGDYLVVGAEPGEKNCVSIQPDPLNPYGGKYLIAETGIAEVHAGRGCAETERVLRCVVELSHFEPSLRVSVDDGHDTVLVSGHFNYAGFDGGTRNDRLDLHDAGSYVGSAVAGGDGRDNINTKNRSFDEV